MYFMVISATLLPCCRASYVCHASCLLTAVGCTRCVSCAPDLTKQEVSAIDPRADNSTSAVDVAVQQSRAFIINYVYNLLYSVYSYLI